MNNPDNYSLTDPVRYRILAGQAFRKRNELSALSQKAYRKGEKNKATILSNQSKHSLSTAKELNNTAASYNFISFNNDPKSDNVILLGLHANEADYILKKRIINNLQRNHNKLTCIAGDNSHSRNKIIPTIERICCYGTMDFKTNPNGSIVLNIEEANIPKSWYQKLDGYSVYEDWEDKKSSKL